eukprot:366410-Chlamydomonas_euryale.AAC.35
MHLNGVLGAQCMHAVLACCVDWWVCHNSGCAAPGHAHSLRPAAHTPTDDCSVPPSALLRWHLLDIVLAYCMAMRQYNGDVDEGCEVDASSSILAASATLAALQPPSKPRAAGARASLPAPVAASPVLPTSAAEACMGFLTRSCEPPLGDHTCLRATVASLHDAAQLLSAGRSAVIVALTHLRALLDAAAAQLQARSMQAVEVMGQGTAASGGRHAACGASSPWVRGRAAASAKAQPLREQRRVLQAASKKLVFLASWANEQDEAALQAVQLGAEHEWRQHQAAIDASKEQGRAAGLLAGRQRPADESKRARTLVEEVE